LVFFLKFPDGVIVSVHSPVYQIEIGGMLQGLDFSGRTTHAKDFQTIHELGDYSTITNRIEVENAEYAEINRKRNRGYPQ
jgi:hypothetical protein